MHPGSSITRASAVLALAVAGASAACSGGSGASAGTFPMNVTTDSGQLRVEISCTPDPPVVGTNEIDLRVTRTSDGAPVDGLTIAVVPFMPSMDHGTSSTTVVPEGGGAYRVDDVYMFMPGLWELETTISGPQDDHAAPSFQLQ